jgi:DNA-binding response OmpR family regulator
VEPHPAVQAVLEHLLLREGYAVETRGDASEAALRQTPGRTPVLLLVGAENGDGLYVFQTRDVAGVLAALLGGAEVSQCSNLSAFGIHAFVPKPFGIVDILRVVRAVGGFDGRKKGPPRKS